MKRDIKNILKEPYSLIMHNINHDFTSIYLSFTLLNELQKSPTIDQFEQKWYLLMASLLKLIG